jgi:hypothetical protein
MPEEDLTPIVDPQTPLEMIAAIATKLVDEKLLQDGSIPVWAIGNHEVRIGKDHSIIVRKLPEAREDDYGRKGEWALYEVYEGEECEWSFGGLDEMCAGALSTYITSRVQEAMETVMTS